MWKRLWKTSAPLMVTGLLMLPVLALAGAGLALDDRLITNVPAWLKPAKFAASIAIYSFTLAWIFSLLPARPRLRRVVGWTTAVTLTLEMVLISMQAGRGVTSHFNVATPFDAAVFVVMGAAILVQTLSAVALAVALWRERFADAALGWALRFGVTIAICGALTGGLMTRPTSQQIDEARRGAQMTVAGAHTVGAPDGGPGLPATGWSTAHGDLRVPHFVGLHALQAMPLLAIVLARRRIAIPARVRMTLAAAVSYASLFVILLVQALRGQPVLTPDTWTLSLLAIWLVATVVAALAAARRLRGVPRPATA